MGCNLRPWTASKEKENVTLAYLEKSPKIAIIFSIQQNG